VLAPLTFLTAPRSNDPLRALGAAVASVTGPTNAAAQATIFADGTRVAPRALNAVEVAVLGLLNIVPAAANGLPGIADAVQRFREQTYAALNLPIVPNPEPTVRPRGVLQVAVVETINVGASVIFPAFNHILSAVFETPDAMARELAATGDPIRALVAGIDTAARRLVAAGTVVAEAVVTAVRNIGTAIDESRTGHRVPPRGTEASADVPTDTDVTTKAIEPGDDTDPGAASATSSPTPKVGDATHADRRHQNAGGDGHKRASRHSPSSTENDESPLGERLSSHNGAKHHDSGDGAQVSRQRRIDDTGVRAH
jgi:hypothetical protein